MSQIIAASSSSVQIMYPAQRELREYRPEEPRTIQTGLSEYIVSSGLSRHMDFYLGADYFDIMSVVSVVDAVRAATKSNVREPLPLRFGRLVAEWKRTTAALSSITAMAMVPQYQEIIGMGPGAIPLILAQLEREGDQPDMWFWALKSITGIDPVSPEDRGDMVAMARAWIDWGRKSCVS